MDKEQVIALVTDHEPFASYDGQVNECACGWSTWENRKVNGHVINFTDDDKTWLDHMKSVIGR